MVVIEVTEFFLEMFLRSRVKLLYEIGISIDVETHDLIDVLNEGVRVSWLWPLSEWHRRSWNISSFVEGFGCNEISTDELHRLNKNCFCKGLRVECWVELSFLDALRLDLSTGFSLPFIVLSSTFETMYTSKIYLNPLHQPLSNIIPFVTSWFNKWSNGMTIDMTIASGKWMFGTWSSWRCAPRWPERIAVAIASISTADAMKHIWREIRLRFSPRVYESSLNAPTERLWWLSLLDW